MGHWLANQVNGIFLGITEHPPSHADCVRYDFIAVAIQPTTKTTSQCPVQIEFSSSHVYG